MPRFPFSSMGLCLLALAAGCSTTATSNTARTATEQLLISNAVDQSLDKVDFRNFSGSSVFLEEKYVDCVDKNYVISSMRHRLMANGARVVGSADDADVVIEMRSGVVGTNMSDMYVGTPEITLPVGVTIPETRFIERKQQTGTAKLGLVAYDPKTGQSLGIGGNSLAMSDNSNWFVLGVGPFQDGSIRREVTRSTTGNAATVRNQLPTTVAFQAPPTAGMQYVEGAEIPAVDQVSHEESADPNWVQ